MAEWRFFSGPILFIYGLVQQLAVLISTTREGLGYLFASRQLSTQAWVSTNR
jgi:hypothetical protein